MTSLPGWRRLTRRWKETLLVTALMLPAACPVWRYEIDSLVELPAPVLVPESPVQVWNSSVAGSAASRDGDGLHLIVHVERLRWESEARDRIREEPGWPLDESFDAPSVFPDSEHAFRRRNLIVTVRPYRMTSARFPVTGHPEIIELAHQVDRNIVAFRGTSKRWDLFGNRIFQKQIKPHLKAFARWFDDGKDEHFS